MLLVVLDAEEDENGGRRGTCVSSLFIKFLKIISGGDFKLKDLNRCSALKTVELLS